ncbi:olfactory receptor 5V1-like [Pseudophryne corroboree]|uniref:olfactory receptor 5V1-like n=1 Tax=Pseudophryne corroboree TaxID=495146 RepID=UPI003081EF96
MQNNTSVDFFYIKAFFSDQEDNPFITSVFFFIYLIGLLANSAIIIAICSNPHLHSALYLFLCNLSFVDICYTTVTVPNLLAMLISSNNKIYFPQCFTQMFFLLFVASNEDMLLTAMAYDRFVAICKPLHYHHILCRENCILLMTGILVASCLNALLFISSALNMSFCYSNTIHKFFCDPKALAEISCRGTELFYIVVVLEICILGFGPFLCSVMSYAKIISIILRMKTNDGRRKAFSTCSSHLIVITMYYGTAASVYIKPPSNHTDVLDLVFTVLFATVTPVLNPLIYSLQNKDIKSAIKRLFRVI